MLSIHDRNASLFLLASPFTGAYHPRNVSPRSNADRSFGRAP
jgi:hypothetical protein